MKYDDFCCFTFTVLFLLGEVVTSSRETGVVFSGCWSSITYGFLLVDRWVAVEHFLSLFALNLHWSLAGHCRVSIVA